MLINRRYKILGKIGDGAVGEVFKAYDVLLDKHVAIKIAKRNQLAEEKLVNEFKITSQFEHPNIISVLDFGTVRFCEDENLNDRKFIVLGYCDTPNILKFSSTVDVNKKFEIIYQICHALNVIHRAGYVHRDLKPENIIYDSRTDEVKITDLGFAIIYEKINPNEAPIGTLLYMAPEVLSSEGYDHRADIYSLGILIYQILTGSLPFDFENPIEIVKWHLSNKKIVLPGFSFELENLLNSMLDTEPSKRPENISIVLEVLKGLYPERQREINFKVRKPFGKKDALSIIVNKLDKVKNSSSESNLVLIFGADGLGKTSLIRYASVEAKAMGYETLLINEIHPQKILSFLSRSPFILNITPELRIKFENFKDVVDITSYNLIEFGQFLRELVLNASVYFPVAIFIDEIDIENSFNEIFLKSLLIPSEFSGRNVVVFISGKDENFLVSLAPNAEKIYLRPFNVDEIKEYVRVNFDIQENLIQELAETLADYSGGISAVIEILSNYLSRKIESGVDVWGQLSSMELDEIISRVEHLSSIQKQILEILALEEEPVEIKVLREFFCADIYHDLRQLQMSGFVKVENDRVSIAYKSLREHVLKKIDESSKRRIHMDYAVIYLNQDMWTKDAEKVLFHFAMAGDREGVEKFAEIGIENLISRAEFKKAIDLCELIFDLLPEYLKPSFKVKLAELNIKVGNFKAVLYLLEDVDGVNVFELKSDAYFHLGDTESAILILKRGIEVSDSIYDRMRLAIKISQIYAVSGNIELAFSILNAFDDEKVLKLVSKTNLIGDFYAGLGIIYQMMGKLDRAKVCFETSAESRIKKGDKLKIIAGYNNLANFYSIIGEYDKAINFWRRAIEISEAVGNLTQTAHIYNNIGISHFKRRNFQSAIENYQKAMAIYRTIGDIPGMANVLVNMGEVLIEEYRLGEAYDSLIEAEKLYEKIGDRSGTCEVKRLLLLIFLYAGDAKRARDVFKWIDENCEELRAHIRDYLEAMVLIKEGNFKLAGEILFKMVEDEVVKEDFEFNLKILILLLKLNYVSGKIQNLGKVLNTVEKSVGLVDDRYSRALIFFLTSLVLDDKIASFRNLNRALDELGDEFSEFAWKVYLEMALYYRSRGVEIKYLNYLEKALKSFGELIERIKDANLIESYISDAENERFYKILRSLTV